MCGVCVCMCSHIGDECNVHTNTHTNRFSIHFANFNITANNIIVRHPACVAVCVCVCVVSCVSCACACCACASVCVVNADTCA